MLGVLPNVTRPVILFSLLSSELREAMKSLAEALAESKRLVENPHILWEFADAILPLPQEPPLRLQCRIARNVCFVCLRMCTRDGEGMAPRHGMDKCSETPEKRN